MNEETIKKVLVNSGLTEKEAEVYIFLSQQNALKGSEIAKLIRKDKAHIFHLLKRLQSKGFVETTLEFPTRYTVVSFEDILNSIIKDKREEVVLIEKTKKDLLDYLRKKQKNKLESSLEKFAVIKGNKRIFSKLKQIIRRTQNQLSVIATVPNLLDVYRSGILDFSINHLLKSQIEYRFITELSEQNLKSVEELLNKSSINIFNFKARNPKLGLKLFPRMIIRDKEEILFFTTPKTCKIGKDDTCLWTNCRSLIQAFIAVFQDLWDNSTDLNVRITEIKMSQPIEKIHIINEVKKAFKIYRRKILFAKKEIFIMTSLGLNEYLKNKSLLKRWNRESVDVKIMAPITKENQEIALELSKLCKVKHIPINYPEVTIIDGEYFFQFTKKPIVEDFVSTKNFEKICYSDNRDYVKKMKSTLNFIWEKACSPSTITIESALNPAYKLNIVSSNEEFISHDHYRRMSGFRFEESKELKITEKNVLDRILKAKKHPDVDPIKETFIGYASVGGAIIHPPNFFNLPELAIQIFHIEKQSTFGEEDNLLVSLRLDSVKGPVYLPTAFVGNNRRALVGWKALLEGTPASQNVQLVKKDEIQVRIHGNSLFSGWTIPIPIVSNQYSLPPSCLLVEGYGEVKTHAYTTFLPSNYKLEVERNGFDAFVTFFHPSSQYSGPGTDGFFARDAIVTIIPPSNI